MNDSKASPDELYRAPALHHGADFHAPRGRGFGSDALRVDGRIFASFSHGRLLVKLPVERVKALVDAKLGEPFSTGPSRVKKEWVTLAPSSVEKWVLVSDEARRYVRSRAG